MANNDAPNLPRQSKINLRWYGYVSIILIYAILDILLLSPLERKIVEFRWAKGYSMGSTILDGEGIVVADILKHDVHPGDVISFADPKNSKMRLDKRIVAEAGQTIEIKDCIVYVDGDKVSSYESFKIIDKSGMTSDTAEFKKYSNMPPITISEGYVFVIGDNFYNSRDSRDFGPISSDGIRGKVLFIFYSSLYPAARKEGVISRIFHGFKAIDWDRVGRKVS